MSHFLQEMRKRKKEEDRVENVQKRARVANKVFSDELEALCVMISMASEKELVISNNRFYTVIRENNVQTYQYSHHNGYASIYHAWEPPSELNIKEIKGNKSVIELNYDLPLETISKIQKFKNIKMIRNSHYDSSCYIEIVVDNLEQVIEKGIFSKLFIMLIEPLIKKDERAV